MNAIHVRARCRPFPGILALALLAAGCRSCPSGEDCNIPEVLDGLSCRVEIESPEVPLGGEVQISLLFESDAARTRSSSEFLNGYLRARKMHVKFRDTESAAFYRREVVDESLGMPVWPRKEDIHSLRDGSIPREFATVRLLSREGEQIPVGEYEIRVVYENEGATTVSPNPAEQYADRLWTGQIVSPPTPLRVVPAGPTKVTVEVPTGIEVERGKENARSIVSRWLQNDLEEIQVTVQPGYVLGMEARTCLSVAGKERECMRALGGSLTWSGDSLLWLTDKELAPPDTTPAAVKVHLRIFETSEPPRHMWMPRIGDFRVLRYRLYKESVPVAGDGTLDTVE